MYHLPLDWNWSGGRSDRLQQALADLQASICHLEAQRFSEHAQARSEAMLSEIRKTAQQQGGTGRAAYLYPKLPKSVEIRVLFQRIGFKVPHDAQAQRPDCRRRSEHSSEH
jgi:hypothetical protein